MNRANVKKKMANKRAKSGEEVENYSNDFKVTLAAICSDDDFKAFKSQFFGKLGE